MFSKNDLTVLAPKVLKNKVPQLVQMFDLILEILAHGDLVRAYGVMIALIVD